MHHCIYREQCITACCIWCLYNDKILLLYDNFIGIAFISIFISINKIPLEFLRNNNNLIHIRYKIDVSLFVHQPSSIIFVVTSCKLLLFLFFKQSLYSRSHNSLASMVILTHISLNFVLELRCCGVRIAGRPVTVGRADASLLVLLHTVLCWWICQRRLSPSAALGLPLWAVADTPILRVRVSLHSWLMRSRIF